MLKITKTDGARVRELVKVLSRTKMEVEGAEEILALGQVLQWAGEISGRILADLKEQDDAAAKRVADGLALLEAHAAKPAGMPPAASEAPKVTLAPTPIKKTQPKRR
jgi:hypothetical protein